MRTPTILSIEVVEPLVIRRCLEHHVRLIHLDCPIGGPVYMRELTRGAWRHLKNRPHVERYGPQCWEVWSNLQQRVIAVVFGDDGGVKWLDDEPDWPMAVTGRNSLGEAVGDRRAGRRGWKPAYQDPRYRLAVQQKAHPTHPDEDDAEPGSIDLPSPSGYSPNR